MAYQLWRQDDNGNRFLVGTFGTPELAQQRMAELTRGVHKQTYWIREGSALQETEGREK